MFKGTLRANRDIRLGCKVSQLTKTLAYLSVASVTKIKSLIALVPGEVLPLCRAPEKIQLG